MKVECKVATVLSDSLVALNAGADKGIQEGDIATVIRREEIEDPDTREVLGQFNRPVLRFRITESKARLSIAKVDEFLGSPSNDLLGALSMYSNPRPRKRVTADPLDEHLPRVVHIDVGELVYVDVSDLEGEGPDELENPGDKPEEPNR